MAAIELLRIIVQLFSKRLARSESPWHVQKNLDQSSRDCKISTWFSLEGAYSMQDRLIEKPIREGFNQSLDRKFTMNALRIFSRDGLWLHIDRDHVR